MQYCTDYVSACTRSICDGGYNLNTLEILQGHFELDVWRQISFEVGSDNEVKIRMRPLQQYVQSNFDKDMTRVYKVCEGVGWWANLIQGKTIIGSKNA